MRSWWRAEYPGWRGFPCLRKHRLVRREALPPGPFEIANLPVTNGLSGVQYVVHDAFGRTQEYSTRAYSSPTILPKGLSDFSYAVGMRRDEFGASSFSYGRLALLAQHRLGLTDRVTGGYRLEADSRLISLGPSLSLVLPVGQLDFGAAGSALAVCRLAPPLVFLASVFLYVDATSGLTSMLSRAASSRNCGSRWVARNAVCSACARSGGIPGGAANGRDIL